MSGAQADTVIPVGDVVQEAVAVRVPLGSAGGDAGGLAHADALERLAAIDDGAHVTGVDGACLRTCGMHAAQS